MNQRGMGSAALEFGMTAPIFKNKEACQRGVAGR